MEKISIEDWAKEEKSRISRFLTVWYANREEHEDDFPLSMERGEWDEQYMLFEDE